jgi:hypothetical protein
VKNCGVVPIIGLYVVDSEPTGANGEMYLEV